jgi:alpha-mannosidase
MLKTVKQSTTDIYLNKIRQFNERLGIRILERHVVFTAAYHHTPARLPLASTVNLKRKPINEGVDWGKNWESGYFKLTGTVPKAWQGRAICADIELSGEVLIYDRQGTPLYGLTNGSAFAFDYAKYIYPLSEQCQGGEKIEILAEAAANPLFGIAASNHITRHDPARFGTFHAKVNRLRLCVVDTDCRSLWLDMNTLFHLAKALPETSTRRARIVRALNAAVNCFADTPANALATRALLAPELAKQNGHSALTTIAVGHAHIDTAWLWPLAESVRKCGRTFASQIANIERYPGYVFGASQAQLYAFTRDHYPILYAKIKQAVKAGRWEIQGGMWVECDCNLTGGEALVRQFLHGKNFFRDEFGVDVKGCWIPDVFGYAATMPQILHRCGIDWFLTQKISWNQFNPFPHHSFLWQGLDGTKMLTHFPPEDTYNSHLNPEGLLHAEANFVEKDRLDEFITLFGIGDGGGGPKDEHIETGLREADLDGLPKVKFGTAEAFFKRLGKRQNELDVWRGELYLELHRATLTTQARMKKWNRSLENALVQLEHLAISLDPAHYPLAVLDKAWKTLLTHQFHDILPGSSIAAVYEDAAKFMGAALQACTDTAQQIVAGSCTKDKQSVMLHNSLSYDYTAAVVMPAETGRTGLATADGTELPTQIEGDRTVALVTIPAHAFLTLTRTGLRAPATTKKSDLLVLENDLVRYVFNQSAEITEAIDKTTGRPVLAAGSKGNVLSLYEDRPTSWDAWDIDFFYTEQFIENAGARGQASCAAGPVRQGIRFNLAIGQSSIVQEVFLTAGSRRLDFVTKVNWHEMHRMLRTSFAVNIKTDRASFDIQYGTLERSTADNTTWDKAAFEVCGHRFADLSEHDRGVAVLNNCKYGWKVKGHTIDLNLLRSSTHPDPDADLGEHEFTYALLPHTGALSESNVRAEAAMLNVTPLLFHGYRCRIDRAPFSISGKGLSLEVIKRAEKSEHVVLRVVETDGRRSQGTLVSHRGHVTLAESDLLEWKERKAVPCAPSLTIELAPFEIKTYVAKPK